MCFCTHICEHTRIFYLQKTATNDMLHTCMHTYTHTHLHTFFCAQYQHYINIFVFLKKCCSPAYMYTYMHTCMRARQTQTQTCTISSSVSRKIASTAASACLRNLSEDFESVDSCKAHVDTYMLLIYSYARVYIHESTSTPPARTHIHTHTQTHTQQSTHARVPSTAPKR
jgi:hypothetical protein